MAPCLGPTDAVEVDEGNAASCGEDTSTAPSGSSNDTNDTPANTTAGVLLGDVHRQIARGVVRAKLSKRRHLVLPGVVSSSYLDSLMPAIVGAVEGKPPLFRPQNVTYNGGVANVRNWKISCCECPRILCVSSCTLL